jgi:Cu/Ag efflux pump CusA
LAALGIVLLPATLVGGLIAALLAGTGLTLGALAGLVAVLGVAARNLFLLVRHCQRLEQVENLTLGPDLVMRVARERLGPTLLAALCTALALAPFALAGNAAGLEVAGPLALVAICGLVSATVVQLFVTPAAYLVLAASPLPVEVRAPAVVARAGSAAAE